MIISRAFITDGHKIYGGKITRGLHGHVNGSWTCRSVYGCWTQGETSQRRRCRFLLSKGGTRGDDKEERQE